jgi:hypothetical protein
MQASNSFTIDVQSEQGEGRMVALRDVPKGEFVRRKEGAKTTYRKGDYDRATKSFSLIDWDDANREIFVKASKLVHVGFTF